MEIFDNTDGSASPTKGHEPPIASIQVLVKFTIVIPTYREVENIPIILERLARLRGEHDLDFEVLFMDDRSDDGSVEAVDASGYDWARIIVRSGGKGLSASVIEGFKKARNPVLICMDCDLSHPPEVIPSMLLTLSGGSRMVIGSRYVYGGGTDDDWGFFRWLNSALATALARPLTRVKDPMSGFFALRQSEFENANELNPIGYKIALELLVKCRIDNPAELPIFFEDRKLGESKLTLIEQLKYIQHVRRLYIFKFTNAMYLLQFIAVGGMGTLVNLAFLTLAAMLGATAQVALAVGIATSVLFNFTLHRKYTFSYAKRAPLFKQLFSFFLASAAGITVNFLVANYAKDAWFGGTEFGLQLAALTGILAGMLLNFISSRFFVFKENHVRSDGGAIARNRGKRQ